MLKEIIAYSDVLFAVAVVVAKAKEGQFQIN